MSFRQGWRGEGPTNALKVGHCFGVIIKDLDRDSWPSRQRMGDRRNVVTLVGFGDVDECYAHVTGPSRRRRHLPNDFTPRAGHEVSMLFKSIKLTGPAAEAVCSP